MAAVLRVKRRNSDEPLIALLVASKRRKTDDNSADSKSADAKSSTAVLKYAGTVQNQEADVIEHLMLTLSTDELNAKYEKHRMDVLDKVREKRRQATIENRYKIVNCFRSINNSEHDDVLDKVKTLIDVEDSVSCSAAKKTDSEKSDDYVYDVYYGNTGDDIYIDELTTVHPFHQEFIYDTYRNGEAAEENETESENSNSESNRRNDYPDTDHSDNSIDEHGMRMAMNNFYFDDDDDDDDDDGDGDDDLGHYFAFAYDQDDVERYGYKYAKYKERIRQELEEPYNSWEALNLCLTYPPPEHGTICPYGSLIDPECVCTGYAMDDSNETEKKTELKLKAQNYKLDTGVWEDASSALEPWEATYSDKDAQLAQEHPDDEDEGNDNVDADDEDDDADKNAAKQLREVRRTKRRRRAVVQQQQQC